MTAFEKWVEVFEVTEWRDGAVFRTKSLGHQWVDADTTAGDGIIWAAPTEAPDEGDLTFRKAKR